MDYLFYTIIHGQPHQMSPSNVERIINKYADMIRNKHPDLPQKVHPHMFRRTRATDLYQSTVDLELVSNTWTLINSNNTYLCKTIIGDDSELPWITVQPQLRWKKRCGLIMKMNWPDCLV